MIKHAGEKLNDERVNEEELDDNTKNVVSALNGTIKKLRRFYETHVYGHDA